MASAEALEAQARALRAMAQAMAAEALPASDELLGLPDIAKRYGLGRDGLLAAVRRGEIAAKRSGRNRILVRNSEMERWLEARPVRCRQRKTSSEDAIAEWERRAESARQKLTEGR